MAIETKVPDIGADEVETTRVLVKVGDRAEAEQSLITVEDDETSMEVPSLQTGIVREIRVLVGNKIQTDALVMIFDSANDAVDAASAQAEKKKEAASAAAPAAAAAKDVSIPSIGSDEVEVTEVLVKTGDKVEAEQPLIIAEGDEAPMKVLTPFTGTMKGVRMNMGDRVSTDSLITAFEVAGEAGVTIPVAKQEATPTVTPAPTAGVKRINVPDIGGSKIEMTEVVVKVDNKTTAGQPLIAVEGDKASMEIPAPPVGVMKELRINAGGKVEAGSLIIVFEVEGVTPAAVPARQGAAVSAPAAKAEAPVTAPAMKTEGRSEFAENGTYVHAAPLIRRLAHGSGVNLAKVEGIGRKGRILHEDVQAYTKRAIKYTEAAPAATSGGIPDMLPRPKVDFSKSGEIEEVELGCIQKISSTNLSRNWVMIPHITHLDKTDTTELEAFHEQQNEKMAGRKLDVEITPVVLIMKVAAAALKQMPHFNSSLSEDGQCLTLKKYINIGVAVGTPNGPIVPTFKNVNKKGIIEPSRKLMTISRKARDGKLTAGEIQDSYFTIPSIGGLGTTHFAPTVNTPEVVIPSISKSTMEPVWNGREFVPRLALSASLSFDYHVTGGVNSTRLITTVNNTLSDIRRLVV